MNENDNTNNLSSHDVLRLPVPQGMSIVHKIQIMIGVGFVLILLVNIFFISAPTTVEYDGRRIFKIGARTFYAVSEPGMVYTENSDSLAALFGSSRYINFALIQPGVDMHRPTVLVSAEDGGGITTLDSLAAILSAIENTQVLYKHIHDGVLDVVIRRTIDTTMPGELSGYSDSLTCERYWPSYPYFLHMQATITDTTHSKPVFAHMAYVVQVNIPTK